MTASSTDHRRRDRIGDQGAEPTPEDPPPPGHSRQAWISVTRIARAPRAHSASMTWLVRRLRNHGPHRDPALVVQRGDGGRLQPGGQGAGLLDEVDPHVVVHDHVAASDDHALQPADQGVDLGVGLRAWVRRTSTASDSRIGAPNSSSPARRSVVPVETTSAMTSATPRLTDGLHRAVEADHLGRHAELLQVRGDQAGVGGGDPAPVEVGDLVGGARARREAERRGAEAQLEDLLGVGTAVQQQVAAGDADVEGALADVDGDVARAQEEELGVVVGVVQDQVAGVGALAVAGLAQHVGGGLGERALVGYGDAQHRCLSGGRVGLVSRRCGTAAHRWV